MAPAVTEASATGLASYAAVSELCAEALWNGYHKMSYSTAMQHQCNLLKAAREQNRAAYGSMPTALSLVARTLPASSIVDLNHCPGSAKHHETQLSMKDDVLFAAGNLCKTSRVCLMAQLMTSVTAKWRFLAARRC